MFGLSTINKYNVNHSNSRKGEINLFEPTPVRLSDGITVNYTKFNKTTKETLIIS